MTALTPEAARAAAAWLEKRDASVWLEGQRLGTGWWVRDLRAEADRLEAASRTPEQVAQKAWDWAEDSGLPMGSCWKAVTAAVIAHHVGPDRVVVDRDDLVETLRWTVGASFASDISKASTRLREALS